MPYPESPFQESFETELITQLLERKCATMISNEDLQKNLKWLCSSPKITSYRVNTLKCNPNNVMDLINQYCEEKLDKRPKVNIHPSLSNVIIIQSDGDNERTIETHENEVIIDADCASAVLRGAHIYAPGVIGMLSGSQTDDKVSIYADPLKKCKKGFQKKFAGLKIFIGNGIVKMRRHQLFGENVLSSGIAVQVTETISGCPPLGDHFLPPGWTLLQNLPSVLCVIALNPKPNEIVLDMCASPGNKTTHIAELMQNRGLLVAVDKTSKKVAQLERRCHEFGANVHVYEADSRNIVVSSNLLKPKLVTEGPPFVPESFDRILLDAPCSVLGKRPQIVNRLSKSEIKSYVPLQRKLFETAVQLLKPNGTLVYSTCTITLSENEGMVAWALKKFDCLDLVEPALCLGGPGWVGTSLTEAERRQVQRFGPDEEVDSVGFFFACFVKKCEVQSSQ